MSYLWDTNILIYYLQEQLPKHAEAFIDQVLSEGVPFVSAISEIELLSWNTTDKKYLDMVRSFLTHCTIIELEQDIKEETAAIRRTHKLSYPMRLLLHLPKLMTLYC